MRMMEQQQQGAPAGEEENSKPNNNNGNNSKHMQNASNKINLVVQKVLLPLLYTPLPSAVSFKQVKKN